MLASVNGSGRMRSASACAVLHRLLRRLGAGKRRLQAVVERLGDALVVMGGKLGDRILQLVARHRRRRETLDVLLHHRRFPGVATHRHIAGVDAPLRRALGRGHPLGELDGGLLLRARCLLEDVEVAAAGRRAAPLVGRQHGDAEREFGVGAHVGEVAGRRPHHRALALEEVLRRRAPLDHARRHHLVLAAEVGPALPAPRSPPACRRRCGRPPGSSARRRSAS